MEPIAVKRGDVFFTRSQSILGRLIRWAETDPAEGATWTNHTGVVVEDGWIGRMEDLNNLGLKPAVVIEALWHARRGPLLGINGTLVRAFGPTKAWSGEEATRIVAAAEAYVGTTYGWWKLLMHLADRAFFKGEKVLSSFMFVKSRPICSFLAAHAIQAAGRWDRPFGMPVQAATPDEMLDFCEGQPWTWTERS